MDEGKERREERLERGRGEDEERKEKGKEGQ